ncbi:glycosyltransferase [Patescibacteria group bacterium]
MENKSLQNFSIILAVYQGEKTIKDAIKSIYNADYPKSKYEVIIIDDGSTDNSLKIIKELKHSGYDFKLIILKENKGRIFARKTGVQNAKYDRVIIFDHQLQMDSDALKNALKYSTEEHIITNAYMDKTRSWDDRILYLFRKQYYKPYWGINFPKVRLDEKNFSKIPKGTGGFITNKEDFLRFSNALEGKKTENEDTKLFKLYIDNNKTLIRVSDIKNLYKNRTGFKSLEHLYKRGPRFFDYYLKTNDLLLAIFLSPLFLALIEIVSLFVFPQLFFGSIITLLLINIIVAIWIAENVLDFIIALFYFPILFFSFYIGSLNGIRLHYLKK